jgi:hypothetical protein
MAALLLGLHRRSEAGGPKGIKPNDFAKLRVDGVGRHRTKLAHIDALRPSVTWFISSSK